MDASKLTGSDGIFATRLHKLMKSHKVTQQDVANFVGTTRQAIAQYADGSVQPNIEKLYKIADYFHVSADYLLGIADVTASDVDDKAINKMLGLSENTINILRKLNSTDGKEDSEIKTDRDFIDLLNFLFHDNRFLVLFWPIIRYAKMSTIFDGFPDYILKETIKKQKGQSALNDNNFSLDENGNIMYALTPQETKSAIFSGACDELHKIFDQYALNLLQKVNI